jgi:hypothetical protein
MKSNIRIRLAAISVVAGGLAALSYTPASTASSCSPTAHFNCLASPSNPYCPSSPANGCNVYKPAGCTVVTRAQCILNGGGGCYWWLVCEYQ